MQVCNPATDYNSTTVTKSFFVRVSGKCMEPIFLDGGIMKARHSNNYLPGDILVVALPEGRPYVHRLIGWYRYNEKTLYVTQADNVSVPDAAVEFSQIMGKICGGDCSSLAVRIPAQHRLRALLRFCKFIIFRCCSKLWSSLSRI